MHSHRTTALRALALAYLNDAPELAVRRRAADHAPHGRAHVLALDTTSTRSATIGALASAMASHIRQHPARALAAHGAGAGTYSVARPTAAEHVTPAAVRPAPAAGYAPDRLVIDPASRTFSHIVGAGVPEHVEDAPTERLGPAGPGQWLHVRGGR